MLPESFVFIRTIITINGTDRSCEVQLSRQKDVELYQCI